MTTQQSSGPDTPLEPGFPGGVLETKQASELNALARAGGSEEGALSLVATRTVYFDITDLYVFMHQHFNVSGIQRVIANIFSSIFADKHLILHKVEFCCFDNDTRVVNLVSKNALYEALKSIKRPNITRENLNKILQKLIIRNEINFYKNDVYIILGAFWISPSYPPLLRVMNEKEVMVGVYIYDLIPITHQKFVAASAVSEFTERCMGIILHSDFIMTISDFVAREVEALVAKEISFNIPVFSVPLSQEIEIIPATGAMSRKVLDATSEPYVLCVGTIEIRKNHIFLARIWEKLLRESKGTVPKLVIVGRWGWHVADLKELLESSDYLDQNVVVLSDIADSELSYLYEHCLFTVYPSIVEGWGLPIGESLAHGKLCIASNTSSMPEVGGEFVQYLDPFNFTGAFDIVSRFINNPIEVREAEMRIKLGFRPRSWNEVVKTMGASIDAVTKPAVSATETRCTLPKAKIILFGTNQQARRKIADFREFTYPLACVDGWDQPEYWGRWALSRMPKVRFTLDGITGRRKLRVALRFQLPSPTARVEVILSSGALQDTVTMKDGLPRWYFINAEADEFGVVDIKFHIKGDIQKVDPVRFLTVGILAMAVVEIDNLNDRMLMMESIRSYR